MKSEVEESEKTSRRTTKLSSTGDGENPIMNRVDLITRTISVLERMSRENEERRALLAEMSHGGNNETATARQAIKDDRVST